MKELELDEILEILADKVESLLVNVGQSDARFKLGETIKYNPREVKQILMGEYRPKPFNQEVSE